MKKQDKLTLHFLQDKIHTLKKDIETQKELLEAIKEYNNSPWIFQGEYTLFKRYQPNDIVNNKNESYIFLSRWRKTLFSINYSLERVLSVDNKFPDAEGNIDLGDIQYKVDLEIFIEKIREYLYKNILELSCYPCTTKWVAQDKIGKLEMYLREKIQEKITELENENRKE